MERIQQALARAVLLTAAPLLLAVSAEAQYLVETVMGGAWASDFDRMVTATAFGRDGSIYFSDYGRLFKLPPGGAATLIAGRSTVSSGCTSGGDGAPATGATFCRIAALAADAAGNVYISEADAKRVRRIRAATAVVETIATLPAAPGELAADGTVLYVYSNAVIYKLDTSTGALTTYAGNGSNQPSGDNGPALPAGIGRISQLALDKSGNLYLGTFTTDGFLPDAVATTVRKIEKSTGIIRTVAGNGTDASTGDGGPATSASLGASGIALDASDNLYIADRARIRVVNGAGVISNFAGKVGGSAAENIPAADALMSPKRLGFDAAGSLFYADQSFPPVSAKIRKITPAGVVSTAANVSELLAGGVIRNFLRTMATSPLAVDSQGRLYLQGQYFTLHRADFARDTVEVIAGTGVGGSSGDGGPATAATIGYVHGIAIDPLGQVYFTEDQQRVRRIDRAGVITTVAGGGVSSAPSEGPATSVRFTAASQLGWDRDGNLLIRDLGRLARLSISAGTVTTVAAQPGSWPTGFAVDKSGDIYISSGTKLQKLALGSTVLQTLRDDTRTAVGALPDGGILLADSYAGQLYRETAGGAQLIAGAGQSASPLSSLDGGPAELAPFKSLGTVAVRSDGAIYVSADPIFRLTPTCAYNTTPGTAEVAGAGGSGNFAIAPATTVACTWGAGSSSNWLKLTGPVSGTGPATLSYSAGASPSADVRTAFISVNGSRHHVAQRGGCSVTLPAPTLTMLPIQSGQDINIGTSATDCQWSVGSTPEWLPITVEGTLLKTATGPAKLHVVVWANHTGATRTAAVTVGDKTLTVIQPTEICTYSLSSSAWTAPAGGGKTKVTATITGTCPLRPTPGRTWLETYVLPSWPPGNIEITAYPNFGAGSRTGAITVGDKTIAVTQPAMPGTADERFVSQLYYNAFGRIPTAAEVQFQAGALAAGTTSRAAMAEGFFRSSEGNLGGRFIAGLYVGLIDRDPEYSGWRYQRNSVVALDLTPLALTKNFLDSQERYLKFSYLCGASLVRNLYQYILRREPADAEVLYHLPAVSTPTGPQVLAYSFLQSAEFQAGTEPRLTTFLAYALLLHRDATASERTAAIAQLAAGGTVRALLEQLLNSAEFAGLLN